MNINNESSSVLKSCSQFVSCNLEDPVRLFLYRMFVGLQKVDLAFVVNSSSVVDKLSWHRNPLQDVLYARTSQNGAVERQKGPLNTSTKTHTKKTQLDVNSRFQGLPTCPTTLSPTTRVNKTSNRGIIDMKTFALLAGTNMRKTTQ